MDKLIEKQTRIKVVILTVSFISALLIGAALFRSGLIYDEWGNGSIPTPFLALKGLWLAGFLSVGLTFVTLCLLTIRWYKTWPCLIHIIISICIVIFSVSAFSVTTSWLNQIKSDGQERMTNATNIISISLEIMEEMVEVEGFSLIYAGRPDCPMCEDVYSQLDAFAKEENLIFYYYNTKEDRDDNKEEMLKILEMYNVTLVPAVIIIDNKEIQKVFQGDKMVPGLKEYLLTNLIK